MMPMHHDRRRDAVQWAKEPRPEKGSSDGPFRRVRCAHRGGARLSHPFLPKQAICRSQLAAIYESMI